MKRLNLFYIVNIFILLRVVEINAQIEITLKRYQSARELLFEKGTEKSHLKLFKPDNDSIALYKYLDNDFYGIIQIGQPTQEFRAIFDTTWADSWVISKNCGFKTPGCWLHRKYDSSRSSTYISNGTVFDVGDYKGYFSTDIFRMGHINVTNQTFAEVASVPWTQVFTIYDGLVGLAYPRLSPKGVTPVFWNIYMQNRIKKPIFSVYINRDKTTDHAGVILLGAIDKKHYNSTLMYVPVTKPFYWEFDLQRITLGSKNKTFGFCMYGCQAAIDTSTKIIVGPADEVKKINRLLGATELYYNRYMIPCNNVPKLPAITYTINGTNYKLHGDDVAQEISQHGVKICLSVFVPSDLPEEQNSVWFLGTAFLQRVYTVFDMGKQRIGFARTT